METGTVVKLPTTAASITEIEFVGYTDANGDFHAFSAAGQNMADNKYIMSYSSMQHRLLLEVDRC